MAPILMSIPFIKRGCRSQKLLAFQYKINNNIVACNKNLCKWGKRTGSLCDLCGEQDDIVHFLSRCQNTQNILQQIKLVLRSFKVDLDCVDETRYFFGAPESQAKSYVMLYTKYIVWEQRFHKLRFDKNRYIRRLTDLIIADKNCMIETKCWNKWFELILFIEEI